MGKKNEIDLVYNQEDEEDGASKVAGPMDKVELERSQINYEDGEESSNKDMLYLNRRSKRNTESNLNNDDNELKIIPYKNNHSSKNSKDNSINSIKKDNNDNELPPMGKRNNALLNSLCFNESNKLESNVINKFDISPYDLMFECCKKKDPRNKAKYQLINKGKALIDKMFDVEYQVRKFMELNFIKQYLFTENELNMFRYHFKPLNMLNFHDTMLHLKKLKSEGISEVTKEQLIEQAMKEDKYMFDIFFDYHSN